MNGKSLGICFACVVAGAIGGAFLYKHREKIKPAAAGLLAKTMCLKEKAANYTAKVKEHAEDIVAEAKHINEQPGHTAKHAKAAKS